MAETLKLSRKEQIEQTATHLFHDRGYASTSMRDLAQGLGIEPASIYSHIKSKEEILQRICFRMADEFFDSMENIEAKNLDPVSKLREAIIGHVRVVTMDAPASTVFFNEYRHLSEPHLSRFLAMRETYENWFRNILKVGGEKGVMAVDDVRFTALTILSSINFMSKWYKPQGKMGPREIGEKLSNLFIKGIEN